MENNDFCQESFTSCSLSLSLFFIQVCLPSLFSFFFMLGLGVSFKQHEVKPFKYDLVHLIAHQKPPSSIYKHKNEKDEMEFRCCRHIVLFLNYDISYFVRYFLFLILTIHSKLNGSKWATTLCCNNRKFEFMIKSWVSIFFIG